MKIISWNIGNFIWLKYFPNRKHYAFQKENIDDVTAMLIKEQADIIFLQEVPHGEEVELITQRFKDHIYTIAIPSYDKESVSLFLSKYPITELHHTYSNDYHINGITFFPIHLNAFSPEKRRTRVAKLLEDLPERRGIILGDTNFWIYNNFFFSKRDKRSYKQITKNHIDILRDSGPTCRFFLSLDKIFITEDLNFKNQKITKHRIGHIDHYMISTEISEKDVSHN